MEIGTYAPTPVSGAEVPEVPQVPPQPGSPPAPPGWPGIAVPQPRPPTGRVTLPNPLALSPVALFSMALFPVAMSPAGPSSRRAPGST
jgi:hypothetical protein